MKVAILYARRDSVYKTLPDLDVWDADRDATLWPGGFPVVAHPPCRAWGALRGMAKPAPGEKALAFHGLHMVRIHGGVLEHPVTSRLWAEAGLPGNGEFPDVFGGFTLHVDQVWWGHRSRKSTKLYVCGCSLADVPEFPADRPVPSCVVESLPKWEREATPPAFARWLVDLARRAA